MQAHQGLLSQHPHVKPQGASTVHRDASSWGLRESDSHLPVLGLSAMVCQLEMAVRISRGSGEGLHKPGLECWVL